MKNKIEKNRYQCYWHKCNDGGYISECCSFGVKLFYKILLKKCPVCDKTIKMKVE